MTRVLSQLLQASEPHFRQSLDQFERLSGHPNIDIRLSSELQQLRVLKIAELGLDPKDTTGPELYAALGERLKHDEQRLRAALQVDDDVVQQVGRHLQPLAAQAPTYALKPAVCRDLLRANPPRQLMKRLGYRSLESMLKHEPAAVLQAVSIFTETAAWQKRFGQQLARLSAQQFERRPLAIEQPDSNRWTEFADTVVEKYKQHVLAAPLHGSVVLLPLPARRPPLAALTTTVLTLRAINDIRALSAYWKLHQLQPGFGKRLTSAAELEAPHGLVAWQTVQQLVSRADYQLKNSLFQPLLAGEELAWAAIEDILANLEPSLSFWRQTAHLGSLKDKITSFNICDQLLNHVNNVPYAESLVQHFQQALHSELLVRYLASDGMRQPFLQTLSDKLVPAMAED